MILSAPECDLEVFVGEDNCGNQELLLNLAVDVILRRYSRCPPFFLPVHPGYREGWSKKTAEELQCWLRVAKPDNTTHTITGGHECNNCFVDGKKDRKCAGRRFFKAETILDLPPHHLRQIWYQLRIGTHWATARSRKKKAKD
ncbi:hypothetical protein B0H14DRAFT_3155361 [Mycena olivaceomarginata]|nr:hypothetical protein B0H14DRAFT_3155361 [Mycena olivaceomarginata]